jgi:hypothetical protein
LRRNPRDLRHLPRRRAGQRRHFGSAVETKKEKNWRSKKNNQEKEARSK